jgi:hypothetical protein
VTGRPFKRAENAQAVAVVTPTQQAGPPPSYGGRTTNSDRFDDAATPRRQPAIWAHDPPTSYLRGRALKGFRASLLCEAEETW